jgi:glycosyltransferase involved in cell wall biosynthesis
MAAPDLDIVICTYNNAELLDRAIAALCAQEPPMAGAWRLLIVDNNCTDHTRAVVERHRSRGGAVPISLVQETTQGLTAARVRGVASTTAPWIGFVDDDCLVDPSWIVGVLDFLRTQEGCGAFGGKVVLHWEGRPSQLLLNHSAAFAEQDLGDTERPLPGRRGGLVGAGLVVRRQALLDCGWVDWRIIEGRRGRVLLAGEDSEICIRIVGAGYSIWYTPRITLRHLIGSQRMSKQYLGRLFAGFGGSSPYIVGLAWGGGYWTWLAAAVARIIKHAGAAALQCASLDDNRRDHGFLQWQRMLGELTTVGRIARGGPGRASAWLGGATRYSGNGERRPSSEATSPVEDGP